MKITDVKVFKREPEAGEAYLGSANIVFDEEFVVYGVRIYNKEGVKYIVMPSRKIKDKWVNVCHPINKECRKKIEDAVFEAYDQEK